MNIFSSNPDFYPTPENVIEQMMMNEFFIGKTILEPSAGKGDIVDWLKNNGAGEVIACENDPNNLRLLSGKCQVIAEDFLSVTSDMVSHIDYIVMNPPFSKGAEDILHAFEIAPAGCTIIALCNNNSLCRSFRNDSYAKLNEYIENYGMSERLGCVFSNGAERNTDVSVALIKLYRPGTGENEFDGYMFSSQEENDNPAGAQGIMPYNVVREVVNRYVAACRLFNETVEATRRINEIADISCIIGNDPNGLNYGRYLPIRFAAIDNNGRSTEVSYARYKKELQKFYWRVIFQKLNMNKYATKQLGEQINKFVEKQSHVPFTMKNIYRMLDIIFKTTGQRMESALLEAFDTICGFSAENSTAGEKWKTNSNYMINRKFIVPYICDYEKKYATRYDEIYVSVSWRGQYDNIEDVTKALCFLCGENYDSLQNIHDAAKNKCWGEWFEWGFFRCKGFKKGTMHFEFLDEKVWHKFNYEVARIRGWELPKQSTSKQAKKNAA